jgi:diguanylate cyclase (GGDEF)-like protein
MVARFAGLASGIVGALIAGVAWSVFDWATGAPGSNPWRHALAMAVRIAAFVLLVLLEHYREKHFHRERTLSRTDPLTGVENSRAFAERAALEMSRLARSGKPLTVAYLDLDDFKTLNDVCGHSVGDGLLCTVAGVVRADIRSTDMVARIGGDEFAILLPETSREEAERILERIRQDLSAIIDKLRWSVGFSAGAVTCDAPASSVDSLLKRADEAMYLAKSSGKNRTRFAGE